MTLHAWLFLTPLGFSEDTPLHTALGDLRESPSVDLDGRFKSDRAP
jgi:hypothetical protein